MLDFDEPMSYTSVDVGGVFLLSAPTESAGAIVQLTAGSGATATTVRATNNRDIKLQPAGSHETQTACFAKATRSMSRLAQNPTVKLALAHTFGRAYAEAVCRVSTLTFGFCSRTAVPERGLVALR